MKFEFNEDPTDQNYVGVNSFCYGQMHELDEFRRRYYKRFHKAPYVNPTTRFRWYYRSPIARMYG
jgi:hypothetical protein